MQLCQRDFLLDVSLRQKCGLVLINKHGLENPFADMPEVAWNPYQEKGLIKFLDTAAFVSECRSLCKSVPAQKTAPAVVRV